MRKVTIETDRLKSILADNMSTHIDEYEEMMEIYHAKAVKAANDLADAIRVDRNTDLRGINLIKPRDYSKVYEEALEMLNYEVEETVTLDDRDFKKFVKDEWEFSNSLMAAKTAYLGGTL